MSLTRRQFLRSTALVPPAVVGASLPIAEAVPLWDWEDWMAEFKAVQEDVWYYDVRRYGIAVTSIASDGTGKTTFTRHSPMEFYRHG